MAGLLKLHQMYLLTHRGPQLLGNNYTNFIVDLSYYYYMEHLTVYIKRGLRQVASFSQN